jgi:spermidine synthase
LGGLFMSLFLIQYLSSAEILSLTSLCNFLAAVVLGKFIPFKSASLRKIAFILLTGMCIMLYVRYAERFQQYCERISWKGFQLIRTENSPYGQIAVTQWEEQFSVFQNGLLVFSAPDLLTAETSVHFALLEHPMPQNILLIGGGLSGGINECLKHPSVQSVDYVELDPRMIDLASETLPDGIVPVNDRVHYHAMDARRYLRITSQQFDVILLNLPRPYTAQLNRYYTVEFYREARKALKPSGLFSFHTPASENVIGPELAEYLSHLNATFSRIFPYTVLIPGETVHFIGTGQPDLLTDNPQILIERLKQRGLSTSYVREYYIPFQMTEERQNYLKEMVKPSKEINRDFRPRGYYFDTMLWATTYSKTFKTVFSYFSKINLTVLFITVFIGLLLIFFKNILRQQSGLYYKTIRFSLISIGFTEISLEVILILAFQVLYGYAYEAVAILISGYMFGLSIGSRFSDHALKNIFSPYKRFQNFQLIMCLYPLAVLGLIAIYQHVGIELLSRHTIWIFILLTSIAGFIGGVQFPLANRLFLISGQTVEKVAGHVYSIDLAGSALGAFLTSAFLLPILGIPQTIYLLSFINFCAFLLLLFNNKASVTRTLTRSTQKNF